MGRSMKESCRPNQAVDGGGKVELGQMGMSSGQSVKPKDTKAGVQGKEKAKQRKAAPKKQQQSTKADMDNYEGKDGIGKTAQAAADITKHYKAKKAAKTGKKQ
jgi:hypothetical protein